MTTPLPESIIANRLLHMDTSKKAIEQARDMIAELELFGYQIVRVKENLRGKSKSRQDT